MKKFLFCFFSLALLATGCRKEYKEPLQEGNPVITIVGEPITASHFGDSLPFTINCEDSKPLSTLKLQLYYSDLMTQEVVVRTKENGTYSGKIFIPFLKDIPDGTANLKLILQNVTTKKVEQDIPLSLTRPIFPYLTLITEDGTEYQMLPTSDEHTYSATDNFPLKMRAYIKSAKADSNGNEIFFGWDGGAVTQDIKEYIQFESVMSNYTATFNTFSYVYTPMSDLKVNSQSMARISEGAYTITDDQYFINMTLTEGETLDFEGFGDLNQWWIDPDFYEKIDDHTLKLATGVQAGAYRIIANTKHSYIYAEVLLGGNIATLQEDGTGAIWIIGDGIGKPSVSKNGTGWTTEKGICMAPIGGKKYRFTGTIGETLGSALNIKFFHQKGWGGEFGPTTLTVTTPVLTIGSDGNLSVTTGQQLDLFGIYTLTVDVSAGITAATLTVAKIGEVPPPPFDGAINGTVLTAVDGDNYKVELDLTQGQAIDITNFEAIEQYWIDPDFFSGTVPSLTFVPIAGKYRITANTALKYFKVEAMTGNDLATLQPDGTGAIWVMGENIGKPSSADNGVAWRPGYGLCMAPMGNGAYKISFVVGEQLNTEFINFKFYFQNGWGVAGTPREFRGTTDSEGNAVLTNLLNNPLIVIMSDGNIQAGTSSFEAGARYSFTVDVSAGLSNSAIIVRKEAN
ncbi:MAG: DUF5125 domain-containing protein [Bacteroidales bacterium]|jgi:hypothetical protein|nr:DUF5125 domain-containing protein [Bacteroidales bacterium]